MNDQMRWKDIFEIGLGVAIGMTVYGTGKAILDKTGLLTKIGLS